MSELLGNFWVSVGSMWSVNKAVEINSISGFLDILEDLQENCGVLKLWLDAAEEKVEEIQVLRRHRFTGVSLDAAGGFL